MGASWVISGTESFRKPKPIKSKAKPMIPFPKPFNFGFLKKSMGDTCRLCQRENTGIHKRDRHNCRNRRGLNQCRDTHPCQQAFKRIGSKGCKYVSEIFPCHALQSVAHSFHSVKEHCQGTYQHQKIKDTPRFGWVCLLNIRPRNPFIRLHSEFHKIIFTALQIGNEISSFLQRNISDERPCFIFRKTRFLHFRLCCICNDDRAYPLGHD